MRVGFATENPLRRDAPGGVKGERRIGGVNVLKETKTQVTRLEDAFKSLKLKPEAVKCDAMDGLIKEAEGINFIGSIEARDIPAGYADVIVCEAFVGNVILKLYEGVSSELIHKIKDGMMSTLKSKIGALLVKPALKQTLKSFDATEYGGAPLLGLKGLVVKTHGSAKAIEIKHAIFQCVQFKQQRINEKIAEKIQPAQFPAPDKE